MWEWHLKYSTIHEALWILTDQDRESALELGLGPCAGSDVIGRWIVEAEGGSRAERRGLLGQWLFVEKYFNVLMTSRILLEHDKEESAPHSIRLLLLGRMKWELARSYKCPSAFEEWQGSQWIQSSSSCCSLSGGRRLSLLHCLPWLSFMLARYGVQTV